MPPKQVATRLKTLPAKQADIAVLEQKMTNIEAQFEPQMGDM